MKTRLFLLFATLAFSNSCFSSPNILFITLDDMNWDSIGSYGCPISDISPHMDSLAKGGMRFEQAYLQAPNCSPSRNVFQSGRYPHTSGVTGFFNIEPDYKPLPQILKENGYFTGAINKAMDSSPNGDYDRYWSVVQGFKKGDKRKASAYGNSMSEFLENAAANGKPFYCVVNVADPHKPFHKEGTKKKPNNDPDPSGLFTKGEVQIPPFLPKNPKIHQEVCNYYNSVKRGDDCVGAILAELKKAGLEKNTLIMLISDHGMPFPFAKSTLYRNGIRTPWIIQWPGKIKPGTVDKDHLISAVDFMPTLLDIVGVSHPKGLQGKSFLPQIEGKKDTERKLVFSEFNENAGGIPRPSRSVQSKKYGYIFNAWATGDLEFASAASSHTSYKVMKKMSDPSVKKRFNYWVFRAVEELYDYEKDPHALNNLINDPAYKNIADKLRKELESWMRETNDYMLSAFLVKNDKDKLNHFMENIDAQALERAQTIQWKRYKNREGKTGKRTLLHKNSTSPVQFLLN